MFALDGQQLLFRLRGEVTVTKDMVAKMKAQRNFESRLALLEELKVGAARDTRVVLACDCI